MLHKKKYKFLLLAIVLFAGICSASTLKKWTIDDILRTEQLISAEISPDGKYVFYQSGFTRDGYPAPPSKFQTSSIRSGEVVELDIRYALTSADPKNKLFRWSPDSKWISYFANPAKQSTTVQVYRISPTGGKPQAVTHAMQRVSDYAWSPDASTLLYVTVLPPSAEETAYRTQWGRVVSPEEKQWPLRKQIWIKELKSGKVRCLPDTLVLTGCPQWSADGKQIAFIHTATGAQPQLFSIDTHFTEKAKQISAADKGVRFFAWAPHNNAIAYITAGVETQPYVNYHDGSYLLPGTLWLHDSDQGNICLTETAYPQLSRFVWSRNGKQVVFIANAPETATLKCYNRYIPLQMYVLSVVDRKIKNIAQGMDFFRGGESITWSNDDTEIWFTNGEGVGYNLFAANVANGSVRRITTGQDCISLTSFSNDFTQATFIRQNVNTKPDIHAVDLPDGNPRRITDINPWVKDYDNEHGEIITYPSEGWKIEALLIKPPGFDPSKKYPLLLVTHGGPNWHKLNEWLPDWEQQPLKAYAAEGYVLLFPNFRGSANYGSEFIKTTHYDLGGMDFRDVMRGVDYLLEQGFIDEKRMGVCGWSYGGFLTPAIISQTTRFKAAQFGAGLPSIEGMYASLWTVERILHKAFDDRPWENGAMHIQYSPLYHSNKVKTPTLIQHGEKDPRCPVGGAILFYKALKSYGVPTVLELYPEMGHSITNPLLYKRILTKNLEWFNKWLKDDTSTSFERIFPFEKYKSYHLSNLKQQ